VLCWRFSGRFLLIILYDNMEPTKFWKDEDVRKEVQEFTEKKKDNRIVLNGEKVRDGLAQLILTVVELLRELMEKQALRRIENKSLSEKQIENLGMTFMALSNEIEKLKVFFDFDDEDLNIDLGPLQVRDTSGGKASVIEILDKLLSKGVVVKGDVVISVAEVDLIALNLGVILASIDKARELYGSPSSKQLGDEVKKLREE
jgi:hypothetical protein